MPVFGPAALIAGAGIGGAVISSGAAKSAAQTQSEAATNAANIQQNMFNTVRSDLAPYRNAGTAALPSYLQLLGLGGDGATAGTPAGQDWTAYLQANPDVMTDYTTNNRAAQGFATPEDYAKYHYQNYGQAEGRAAPPMTAGTPGTPFDSSGIQKTLEGLPGYQFTRDQGIKSLTNQLSASGLGGTSGAYAKGIARYVTGLADTTYGEQLNRLQTAVAGGQTAANQTGTFGTNTTANIANTLQGGAQATASGIVGSANAVSGGLNAIPQAYLTSRILGMYGSGGAAPGTGVDYASLSGLY